jgi:hypothetical protein
MHPPGSNPNQRQIFYALVAFENFMGNASDRPRNVSRIHHQPFKLSVATCHHHPISPHDIRTFYVKQDAQNGRPRRAGLVGLIWFVLFIWFIS